MHFVGCDGHSDSRAAHQNAAVGAAFSHFPANALGVVRVVGGLRGIGSEIDDFVPAEEIDETLRSRPAQAWLEGDVMKITALN